MSGRRTTIVTGGTSGIGAAIARAFHDAGDSVVIAARNDNGFAQTLGERARFVKTDVTRPEELRGLVSAAMEWTGRVDVMINNAGASGWRPLDKIDEDFWQRMQDVNLKSVLFGCQAAAAAMGEGGAIINVSSMAAKRGTANNAVYCAAKFGVNGITQALAKELGPRGIRVNAVCPVLVTTDGLSEALVAEYAPAHGKRVEEFLEGFTRANAALGRLPTADEVAQVCLYLASPAASAITGQCPNVDCGVFPQ
jgi:3-oxoacyl-[acyl-carrier protein] reductase/meso-butanediol dehydrogenase/(S,S)-butanediol dehydrogenase/diacetyl reductase